MVSQDEVTVKYELIVAVEKVKYQVVYWSPVMFKWWIFIFDKNID